MDAEALVSFFSRVKAKPAIGGKKQWMYSSMIDYLKGGRYVSWRLWKAGEERCRGVGVVKRG